ncbi:hypothetical protein COCC4DRAFT_62997 [Bipolaris maydis ATCC 48331]|uniref:Uncharacterized protein n=2 Tax=Cochliobolus heterostrophus TaxID=5016 RepID=M2TK09_COCH5|nr:uncharacterized protein COCC4DRAFT_62997 [Bipolaris maydis ATCC 48331]EMD86809.1 hypothetical protein COCHEDRAFT_1034568 [Bipolaris maydis C5]ENI03196.1 hypothetical protein COCC4DRAFT_62997 [Bipolaris maydis ATCC 48331]
MEFYSCGIPKEQDSQTLTFPLAPVSMPNPDAVGPRPPRAQPIRAGILAFAEAVHDHAFAEAFFEFMICTLGSLVLTLWRWNQTPPCERALLCPLLQIAKQPHSGTEATRPRFAIVHYYTLKNSKLKPRKPVFEQVLASLGVDHDLERHAEQEERLKLGINWREMAGVDEAGSEC